VIIEYCCAIANELPASSKVHSFPTDLDIYTSSPDREFEG